eukprot:TRINITY_DN5892_c0_g1_i1.p1 TRINITY_DN5892_c0_g1~~TRINITY_DN5892_c0_g1_i1.p1  ORF type:complete len:374 (-),score=30.20 TRINITY_DN5892_c0_g1_i1:179-1243(-)
MELPEISNEDSRKRFRDPNDDSLQEELKSRTSKACMACRNSHMSCGNERPCKRCTDRAIPHLCVDAPHKRRGRKGKFLESQTQNLNHSVSIPITASIPAPGSSDNLSVSEVFDMPDLLLTELLLTPMPQIPLLSNVRWDSQGEVAFSGVRPWSEEVLKYLKLKIPEEFEAIHQELVAHSGHSKHILSILRETADEVLREFNEALATYSHTFNQVTVPTICFDNSGVIHYANQAFLDMTGFDVPIPTERSQFAVYEGIAPRYLAAYLRSILAHSLSSPYVLFPAEVRSYGSFIDANLWITFKRNANGVVLLHVASIIPSVNALVAANNFSSVMKQKGAAKAQKLHIFCFRVLSPH